MNRIGFKDSRIPAIKIGGPSAGVEGSRGQMDRDRRRGKGSGAGDQRIGAGEKGTSLKEGNQKLQTRNQKPIL